MSLSLKVFNCPRGMEQDLVRLMMNNRFSLTKYAVNNSDPYDTVIDFSDPASGPGMVDFIRSKVTRLRGQHVQLDAQLQIPPNVNIGPAPLSQKPQQHRAPANGPHASTGPPRLSNGPPANGPWPSRFGNGPTAAGPSRFGNGPTAAVPSRFSNGSAAAGPFRSNNAPSQLPSTAPRRPDKLKEIRRNVRSLLATEKKGLDAMRFVNNYVELTSEPFFDAIRKIGYNTVTDFCNDNLDCIDYEAWDNGAIAILHGVPDAKTAHIYQMNQATRSKNAPNCRPIPNKFRAKFGNFFKPRHKVLEMQSKMFNEPLELPDKHRRRIIAVIDTCPQGLSTEEVKLKYSEMYEEPFPLQHLREITKKRNLEEVLALIPKLRHINGRWVAINEAPPENPKPAQPAPLVPKDISKSPEFLKLKTDVITALKNTTDYTMTLTSLQKSVNIDVVLFGKSSAAELLDLIDEVKIRESKNSTWIVHLKHKGQDLSYRVLQSIYSTLNSDPNGLLLEEFSAVYQRMTGRNLIATDYGYKSLWHIFYNHSDMVSMSHTRDGLLLIAEKAPEPPSHPPGFPEPRNGSLMTSSVQSRASSSLGQATSSQNQATSLKEQAASNRPDFTGDEEIALGYKEFKEDGEFVIVFIYTIYSPNQFYVWFAKNSPEEMEEYKNLTHRLNTFYNSRANRGKHILGQPFKRNHLCVFSDEKNRYHRAVIDIEPSINSDIVAVRDIDTGVKSEVASSCLYRIAQEFKEYKCFARRCALCDVRPFNGTSWDPKSQEVFGPKHAEKLYFAKIMSLSDQEVELNVIDTHYEEDRHFGDVLVAEGYAENISGNIGVINNAPSTPNDSFNVEEEDDDDDDWLNEWLADEDTPVVDNIHVNFSAVHVSNPAPALIPLVQIPSLTNPAPPRTTTNLWDTPLADGAVSNSSSEFLKNLMQVNRKR